jgi:hypothetical protein
MPECPGGPNRTSSPEREHDQEAEEGGGADARAAEIKDALAPGLRLLARPFPPDELLVPEPGHVLRRAAAPPPGRGHGGGDGGQPVPAADAGAVGVLDAQADLPDVAAALVARDGGVERDAAAEHDGEARHGVPREPLAVDGHGAAAGRVERAAGGRVEEDPAELEVGRRDRRGGRRREALLQQRVDAERRAQEPVGGGVRLHDARQDADPRVAQVDGRHEARGQGLRRRGRGDRAREGEGVGEERPVTAVDAACAGQVADGGPHGEAERPPRGRVGGEAAEAGARAADRRQRRAIQAAEHEGEDVRREVLDARAADVVAGRRRGFHRPNTHGMRRTMAGGRPTGRQ